jgi:hypothetical protein
MTGTRVLLLSDGSPLSLGAEVLLRERTELEVMCHPDAERALEWIGTFKPQAVVVGAALLGGEESGWEWLHAVSEVPGMRLIRLSVEDNRVQIEEGGQMRTVPDATGLLDALLGTEEKKTGPVQETGPVVV